MIASPLPSKTMYVCPQDNDVKCGRGSACFNHPGNALLRVLVAMKLEEYRKQATRSLKTKVIDSVSAALSAQGTRFLKLDRSVALWYDGGIKAAKDRIGSAFRDASQPNKVKCMENLKAYISANDRAGDRQKLRMAANGMPSGDGGSYQAPLKELSLSTAIDRDMCDTWGHLPTAVSDDEELDSASLIEAMDDIDDLLNEKHVGNPKDFTRPEREFLAALDWTKLASCVIY